MKNAFERMGRRIVSLLMVVCLMLGMVGTAFAAESKKEQAEMEFGMAVGSVIGGATIKDKVEAAKAIAVDIIAKYESKYELAYGYAVESGYVAAAVEALGVAAYAMNDAIAYVEAMELEADIKEMALAELAATKATIAHASELLDDIGSIDAAWATILSLKDEMHAHRDALAELGLAVGQDLDPYVQAMNDAVESYIDMVEAIAAEAAAQHKPLDHRPTINYFAEDDIAYLRSKNCFSEKFLEFLRDFKFRGDIWAVPEGTVVFPGEPLMIVRGRAIEAQFIETYVLMTINHQSLIATKAARLTRAAKGRAISEFGSRRAQGADAAILGARAAYIGGCNATACTITDEVYGVPATGTMAHSWVQMFDTEYEAFKTYCEIYPNNATLLVDTYNVLESGIPNAIRVFNEVL